MLHNLLFTGYNVPQDQKKQPQNIEMLKTQWIFISQAKFCLSAGPFFATPIEDSRSHCQKPIMFSPSYARSYTKNKVSEASKNTSKNHMENDLKNCSKFDHSLLITHYSLLIIHYSLLITSRLVFVWYVLGIRLVLAW